MAEALLDLKTAAGDEDRPFINIDGQKFHLALMTDLDIVTQANLVKLGKRMRELGSKEMSEDEAREVSGAMKDFMRIVVRNLPDAVNDKMGDGHRLEIVKAFTTVAGLRQAELPKEKTPEK